MVLSVLVGSAILFAGILRAGAAFQVGSDFEGGSARVLELNPDTQTIRITPAGDVKRGMPNWWYLRLDGVDTNKPIALEVVALEVTMPLQTEKTATPLNPGWTLPTCAAISTNGIKIGRASCRERV